MSSTFKEPFEDTNKQKVKDKDHRDLGKTFLAAGYFSKESTYSWEEVSLVEVEHEEAEDSCKDL